MKHYETRRLLEEIRRNSRPVVIFGAGDVGKLAHHALVRQDVDVTYFCDGNPKKQGGAYHGVKIISENELSTVSREAHIFVSANYLDPISSLLTKMGFTNVYDCADLLDRAALPASEVGMDPVFIERKIALHRRECQKARERSADELVLKYLDVVVTEACSMKCQDCSNLMQYYTAPRHSDLDLLESALDRIMESIDRIYEFRVLGGEPFVNKNVHRVIDKLVGYDRVDKVVIYTNATIVPRGANLESLRHAKVVVDITNYGEHSKKYSQMLDVLEANEIAYLTKIPQWTDSGRIKLVERPAVVLDDMFRNCCVNDVLTLLNGKVYRCPFSANGTNLGAIPDRAEDVVDLTGDLAGDDLRKQLRALYGRTTHLAACAFCNGRDFRTPRIEAAIQIRRPLPLI